MTVASELAKRYADLQFILCVEGVGWPVTDTDLSSFWEGTLFVTNDPVVGGQDTEQRFGAYAYTGLELPRSIKESLDPIAMVLTNGGIDFSVIDTAGWWEDNFHPLLTDTAATIDAAVQWGDTVIDIDEANKTFAAFDVVYLGRTEAVLLGPRALVGGTVYRYSGCTRGYRGTPRGRHDNVAKTTSGFAWEVGTAVRGYNMDWYDRRVAFFAHDPKESRANALRLYTGRIRYIRQEDRTNVWKIGTIVEDNPGQNTTYLANYQFSVWLQQEVAAVKQFDGSYDTPASQAVSSGTDYSMYTPGKDLDWSTPFHRRVFKVTRLRRDFDYDDLGDHPFKYAYNYRAAPGGTAGAVASGATTPQTVTTTVDGATRYHIQSVINIGGHMNWALHMGLETGDDFRTFWTEAISPRVGNVFKGKYDEDVEVRLMLDNHANAWEHSRFAVNRQVSRNPVDVMLMLFTSMDGEFFIANAAAGGTTTTINFTAPGWAVNQWAGYAVFCPYDPTAGNSGYTRTIVSNTATQLTVDRPLPSAVHVGKEYQIRNTIYDCLPIGFGMSVENALIDIGSFTSVRDQFYSSAQLGVFAIGDQNDFDLYNFVVDYICRPYGMLLYVSRNTGKLSLRHIGHEPPDGLQDTYTSVTQANILEMGDQDPMPRRPVSSYVLRYRARREVSFHILKQDFTQWPHHGQKMKVWNTVTELGTEESAAQEVTIRLSELEQAFPRAEFGSIEISAMLNDRGTIGSIMAGLINRLVETSVPPPEMDILLDASYIATDPPIQAGSILSITDTTRWRPLDPQTGTRGWTGKLCRVLSSEIVLAEEDHGLRCTIQVLGGTTSAKIAPAATVTAKGTYGTGTQYFVVNDNDYTPEGGGTAQRDWGYFAVDDWIQLCDITGAVKESEQIESFGANEAATPGAASTSTVNVVGGIAAVIVAGDYITYLDWLGTPVDSNRPNYCALADANGTLGAANDAAKEYA